MENVIEREAAELELDRIVAAYEVDPEGPEWDDSKKRLISAIQKGRITLDVENMTIGMRLVSKIELENGKTIAALTFKEPTADDLRVLDKYKGGEGMAKTIHLASKMTGEPIGTIGRMIARDLSVMGAIASLFF